MKEWLFVSRKHVLYVCLLILTLLLVTAGVQAGHTYTQDPTPTAQIDESGNVIGETPAVQAQTDDAPPSQAPNGSLSVLCFTQRLDSDPCGRVANLFTNTTEVNSVANFPANLSAFDVIYIAFDEGDAVDSKAADLQSFVDNGGGLIVSQPNLEGTVDVYPPGFEMTVSDIAWPEYPSAPGPVEFTAAGSTHPILNGLTPDDLSGNFDTVPISQLGPGWTILAKAVNDPIAALLAGQYGSGRLVFHTGNIGSLSIDPGSDAYLRQMIEWAGTANIPDGEDMQIDNIEVTQAIQDLNNSVELIAGKRTFVRVHVSAPSTVQDVYATLSGSKGGTTLYPTLSPLNPGADIDVRVSPDRGQVNDSFLFELPSSWTAAGNLTLTARLDPANAKGDPDPSDNVSSLTVPFLSTPSMALRLYNVQYTAGGTTYVADASHLEGLESWLRRAYPIHQLNVTRHTFTYPKDGLPDVDELHGYLALGKILRIIFAGEDGRIIYYGIVDDGGGFMRGKALDIPSTIAAGPTGTPSGGWAWDTDGTYGDWYGAHEIAHTRDRYHAEFCGAGGGVSYPYSFGRISPALTGNTAIFGFDIEDHTIYDSNWRDVMTYCNNQWISDFTYEGIRDYLETVGSVGPISSAPVGTSESFLVVSGLADLDAGTAELFDMYLLDEPGSVPLPEPGDWTLRLLGNGDSELASHPFQPMELTDSEEETGRPAVIALAVPAPGGLQRVEIVREGHTVASQEMSEHDPQVEITFPPSNSEHPSGPIQFEWEASDPDGDDLTHTVLFSNNGGENWEVLATGLISPSLTLHTDQLPGGGPSQLKVISSDGLRSNSDTTGAFYLPLHAPQANIISPADEALFWPAQLVSLNGEAHDGEDGLLSDDALSWTSDRDGFLGTGSNLSTVDLSTGQHVITLEATDSDGLTDQDQITITVLSGDDEEPNLLRVAPNTVNHIVEMGGDSFAYTMTVRSDAAPLSFSASKDSDWLSVTPLDGETPGSMMVTLDPAGLAPGTYTGEIVVTAPGAPNGSQTVVAVMEVLPKQEWRLLLPLILR
ncbi:MAG TPA: hypothetical protein VK879_20470 [Candidatus Sulfomarinibacteraceae bacterium]|nr:hypothetical protein [Candidatus Sulfomarinibacteraceae bacterium]